MVGSCSGTTTRGARRPAPWQPKASEGDHSSAKHWVNFALGLRYPFRRWLLPLTRCSPCPCRRLRRRPMEPPRNSAPRLVGQTHGRIADTVRAQARSVVTGESALQSSTRPQQFDLRGG